MELEQLPAELASRVNAATAHAAYRHIEQRSGGDGPDAFEVFAWAGDRLVHMVLSLRPDGSVAEATETFLRRDIVGVVGAGDHTAVEVQDHTGRRTLPVPGGITALLGPGSG